MTDCIEPPVAYEETPDDGVWIEEDGEMVFHPAPGFVDPEAEICPKLHEIG